MSLDLLGAESPRGILIRVRNATDIVERETSKQGKVASLAGKALTAAAPSTTEGLVLGKMAEQFRGELAKNGVDADVSIVAANEHQKATNGFGLGVLAGAGVSISGFLLWHFGLGKLL